MANNLSIEAPNFEKIEKEAGPFTSTAVSTLWAAYNDTRKTERLHFAIASSELFCGLLVKSAAASVDNLDMRGYDFLQFTGASAQNFTGIVAPETGKTKLVFVKVTGAGTITAKHGVTSEVANRLALGGAVDFVMTTGKGLVLGYVNSLWQEIARSA